MIFFLISFHVFLSLKWKNICPVGDLIMEDNVKCAQEVEGWDLFAELRFIVQDGEIIKARGRRS